MPHLRGELEQRKTSRDRMMKEEEGREQKRMMRMLMMRML
jgi:hypothetical protein